MRALLLLASLLLTSRGACGQVVLDNSGAELPPEKLQWIITTVTKGLRDPQSAQFRGLKRPADLVYCGEVNARSIAGGYAGFRQFVIVDGSTSFTVQAPYNDGQFERSVLFFGSPGRC